VTIYQAAEGEMTIHELEDEINFRMATNTARLRRQLEAKGQVSIVRPTVQKPKKDDLGPGPVDWPDDPDNLDDDNDDDDDDRERDDESTKQKTQTCPLCRGTGRRKSGLKCSKCQGRGRISIVDPDEEDDDKDARRAWLYEFEDE
jgi:hypothetical protein